VWAVVGPSTLLCVLTNKWWNLLGIWGNWAHVYAKMMRFDMLLGHWHAQLCLILTLVDAFGLHNDELLFSTEIIGLCNDELLFFIYSCWLYCSYSIQGSPPWTIVNPRVWPGVGGLGTVVHQDLPLVSVMEKTLDVGPHATAWSKSSRALLLVWPRTGGNWSPSRIMLFLMADLMGHSLNTWAIHATWSRRADGLDWWKAWPTI